MRRTVGVIASEYIAAGLVENHQVVGGLRIFPEADTYGRLQEIPADDFADEIAQQVLAVANGAQIDAVGIGVPGIVRDGVVEESPNLEQLKGIALESKIQNRIGSASVFALNDADAIAAGIAASRNELDRLTRVWTLGTGIGFGRYPRLEGIWEGGHCVVSLDPKERYCGCGGVGHLEGIMGARAMRLRFLEYEPDEVFENAAQGDERCRSFVKLWHRALAAATGSSIHLDGPGKVYITGPSAKYVDSGLLNLYLQETVRMSFLQGSFLELIKTSDEIAILGAAVAAEHRIFGQVAAAH